ncbi:MAG: hypothetical protein IT514_16535, partial [Burkholderiales bacterium]|nr:hypothetical protein [Burkholderiales bacterium]
DTGDANGDIWRVAICSAANGTGLFSSVKLGAATTKTNQQQLNCTYDHVFTWS